MVTTAVTASVAIVATTSPTSLLIEWFCHNTPLFKNLDDGSEYNEQQSTNPEQRTTEQSKQQCLGIIHYLVAVRHVLGPLPLHPTDGSNNGTNTTIDIKQYPDKYHDNTSLL
jgi:hypothetical protein